MKSKSRIALRVVQGPLQPHQNEVILSEYNRLTSSQIAMRDFLHWVQDSPAGPSWHAIFETDDCQIVGHSSLIPLRGHFNGNWLVPAKSEYGFIQEEYRTARVRGFENMSGPRHIIMIDELFKKSRLAGWGPFLISGSRPLQRFGFRAECYRVGFPLWECLLVLRPRSAALKTPNISQRQGLLLGLAGVPQRMIWSLLKSFPNGEGPIRPVPIDEPCSLKFNASLSFFEDQDSLRWRYWDGQYERLALDETGQEYLILKKGSGDGYLRACQWNVSSEKHISYSLVARLVRTALEEGALGVRWAVYGHNGLAKKLAQRMQRFGFLVAPRVRTLLVQSKEQEFLAPENWNLTDAMFCFDF